MKKAVIFIFLTMVVIGSCAAQSANDAKRIVGTWVSENSAVTLVFNANGTGTFTREGETENFSWGFSVSGEIYLMEETFKLFMSPDGRRMIIDGKVFQKK